MRNASRMGALGPTLPLRFTDGGSEFDVHMAYLQASAKQAALPMGTSCARREYGFSAYQLQKRERATVNTVS